MSVFVSVGTTSFEELIKEVDSQKIKTQLEELGYKKIICQIGEGEYTPKTANFRRLPSLIPVIEESDLVISHAGAGIILDTLRSGKKLIVVVNPRLMNNHQTEIAEHLSSNKHLIMCSGPSELSNTLRELATFCPVPLPPANVKEFKFRMMRLLGLV